MKNKLVKKLFVLGLAAMMVVSTVVGCGKTEENEGSESNVPEGERPDTWIAERTITVQPYVNDVGYNLPESGVENTMVAKELESRTGIKTLWQYTPGDSDQAVVQAHLAAGNIADLVYGYMDNSSRPEYPIINKAANEGVFADLRPYIEESEIWSKYLEEGYLGTDAWNIINNPEWDGAIYFLPLSVDRDAPDSEWKPMEMYRGGMYIRADIAADLGIEDTTAINTQEEFMDLCKQIKAKGYTDNNGQPISVIGPRIWGGHMDAWELVTGGMRFATSNYFGVTEDGQVMHEAQTDAVYEIIDFVRELIDEDLLHAEFFSMDETRCHELAANKSVAIVASTHNYVNEMYTSEDWIPLGPLGSGRSYYGEKGQYGWVGINAEAENPEEIFKFLDYINTREGKLLVRYGIEGETYTLNEEGNPVLTEKAKFAAIEGDKDYLCGEVGAYLNNGLEAFHFMLTDYGMLEDFGEAKVGAGAPSTDAGWAEDDMFARAYQIAADYPQERVFNPGMGVNAFLNKYEDQQAIAELNLVKDTYVDMVAKAIYADSDAEVQKIVETFRKQLESAGIEEINAYLTGVYAENPDNISFTNDNEWGLEIK